MSDAKIHLILVSSDDIRLKLVFHQYILSPRDGTLPTSSGQIALRQFASPFPLVYHKSACSFLYRLDSLMVAWRQRFSYFIRFYQLHLKDIQRKRPKIMQRVEVSACKLVFDVSCLFFSIRILLNETRVSFRMWGRGKRQAIDFEVSTC